MLYLYICICGIQYISTLDQTQNKTREKEEANEETNEKKCRQQQIIENEIREVQRWLKQTSHIVLNVKMNKKKKNIHKLHMTLVLCI